VVEALFPRDDVDRLLERSTPEALRAAILAPLPDPLLPVRALFSYGDPLAERLVLLLKESRSRAVAASAGALLADEILAWIGGREESGRVAETLLVPVPLSAAARRERGYSQTEILCEGILGAMAGGVVRYGPRALAKPRETPKQAILSRAARLENVRGAFVADGSLVRGRAVALVDDVATTGATLRSCRHALRRAGAVAVGMFAVARA
jgi:predicted amidophosphoribosyltransferase